MKKAVITVVVILTGLVIFLLTGPFYILEEGMQAVVIRFGRIENVETAAGLKFKVPLLDNVKTFTKKIISWDGQAQTIPTVVPENQLIWVDTTARWRISDLKRFYESTISIDNAHNRLDDIIDSSVRTVISENLLLEAIRNSNTMYEEMHKELKLAFEKQQGLAQKIALEERAGAVETSSTDYAKRLAEIEQYKIAKGREHLSQEMLKRSALKMITDSTEANQFGIELIDIVIRQIKYSDDLTKHVYQSMIQERNQAATKIRAEGESEKSKIEGQLSRKVNEIESLAKARVQEIMGTADAKATSIYARAYGIDPDFFKYWRTLESYKKLLPKFKKTLSTDADYFDYLYNPNSR